MDKKYQVFISSTFEDLKEERLKVQEAILDMGCIPSCMEYFPAGDKKQFEYIKNQIDMSDYMIIISANAYGSIADDGKSYTEKEYWYAKEKGIPIIAFLNNVFSGEDCPEKVKLLEDFRNELKDSRIVKFWSNPEELKSQVLGGLYYIFNEEPRTGWVRAGISDEYVVPRFFFSKEEPKNPCEGDVWIG
ncbi:MAG: DUF4062 domain-containing protein [Lachnospiraceae bacterium]|nr:DUF4062 domain-containing protein [Lachnospiraceae bacterium]